MGLPASQRRVLRRAEVALEHSDPRLAALFCLFTKLSSGERMPRTEDVHGRAVTVLALRPFGAFRGWLAFPRRARLRAALFLPVALGLVASALLVGSSFASSSKCTQALRISRSAYASSGPKRPRPACPPKITTPVFTGR
jgi:hypothetical protein